jgi:hypothetical protein
MQEIVRVGDCFGFVNLDAFGAEPIDNRSAGPHLQACRLHGKAMCCQQLQCETHANKGTIP